ncbi:MAG: hypothetical protein J6D57_12055 [Mogibacterium sp.]|nr:hypothetical protein [Mogibacterium sp.]
MYSVEDHSDLGAGTGAMINSVTRFPMIRAANGQVLDIKFTPSVIAGETGAVALRALIDTYYRKSFRLQRVFHGPESHDSE